MHLPFRIELFERILAILTGWIRWRSGRGGELLPLRGNNGQGSDRIMNIVEGKARSAINKSGRVRGLTESPP